MKLQSCVVSAFVAQLTALNVKSVELSGNEVAPSVSPAMRCNFTGWAELAPVAVEGNDRLLEILRIRPFSVSAI